VTMEDTQNSNKKATNRVDLGGESYDKSTTKQPPKKREFMVFKYKGHEAVVVKGISTFVKIDNDTVKLVNEIPEESRTIIPPHLENYPYPAYEFEDINEVKQFLEKAKYETIDSLFTQAKTIASNYNNQSVEKVSLLAIDIIISYFQDKLPTIHYDVVLGDNGVGKSTWGDTYASVGYRAMVLTDPNAANILRILGCIEPGQCTIIADEAFGLDKNPELLAVLKTGYQLRGKTSKINDYTRNPEFFSTYCFKIIISDKMGSLREIKGVRDRSFDFVAHRAKPTYDIKETLEPQDNPKRLERLKVLNDFRRVMLMYRLIHFNEPIRDIDVGVDGRDKELVKPVIQIFYGWEAQQEVVTTLQYFLNMRNEKKDLSIEPILCKLTIDLMNDIKKNEIYLKDAWEEFKRAVKGHSDVERDREGVIIDHKRPNEYHTEEYGTVYNKTIANIYENVFGGKPKRKTDGTTFTFNKAELERILNSYGIGKTISVVGYEGNEGNEGNTKEHHDDSEIEKNTLYIFQNNNNNNRSRSKRPPDKSPSSSGLPSLPSLPSPDLDEVETMLKRLQEGNK
jgi:hypothetical protein